MRFDPENSGWDEIFEAFGPSQPQHAPVHAKLVGDEVVPCSFGEWVEWLATGGKRVVKQEIVGERYWISTVFLGVNHSWRGARGVWFESMIFDQYGRDEQHGFRPSIYCERHSTMAEARRAHLVAVEHARQLLSEA